MNNGRYHLEDRHHDNSFSTEQYSGTWANEADRLILFEGQAIIAKYQLAQGKLKTLERQGILFNDSLANKNILARRPSILENLAWKNKKDAGMEVYGVGTEPFWNISIGKQLIIFNHIDSGPVQFAYTEPEYRGDSIIYSLPADSLRIILSAGICNDGMSDFFYDYSIDVSLKKQVFRGCGSYFGTEARKPGKLVSRIEQNKNPAF